MKKLKCVNFHEEFLLHYSNGSHDTNQLQMLSRKLTE